MAHQFSLFQSHLDIAHSYWKQIIRSGDVVVDATCGNGNDSLVLAQLAINDKAGKLIACDIQQQAIMQTRKLLQSHLSKEHYQRVELFECCHASLSAKLMQLSAQLIVYNLGYLPGGDKRITTQEISTLESLKNMLRLINQGGCMSITCYPGHPEGEREERAVLSFVDSLDPRIWSCCHHRWLNRKKAPSLLILQKSN